MVDRSLAVDVVVKLGIELNTTDIIEILEMMAVDFSSQLLVGRRHDEMRDGARDRATLDDTLPYFWYAVADHVLKSSEDGARTA